MKSYLLKYFSTKTGYLFLGLIFLGFPLQAQEDICPIEVTEGPCFEKGSPCVVNSPEELGYCLQFTEEAKSQGFAYGATITYNYSQLSSGAIRFDDFMTSAGCEIPNADELRGSTTSRRIRPSSFSLKGGFDLAKSMVDSVCAEWYITWNYYLGYLQFPDGSFSMFPDNSACQYVIVRVMDDGSTPFPPIPQYDSDVVMTADSFLNYLNVSSVRNNPRLYFDNFYSFASFEITDEPNLPSSETPNLEQPCTTVYRTWIVSDWCGNETLVRQRIHLLNGGILCESDSDADGVCDVCDKCPGSDDHIDTDLDNFPDACELCVGDITSEDSDGDGICDDLEACAAGVASSDCEPIKILTPRTGDVLDNGCLDRSDTSLWYFEWTAFPFAERYHLKVLNPDQTLTLIDEPNLTSTSFQTTTSNGYFTNPNLLGWTVVVRAFFGNTWTAWSPAVTFDLENVNTDCENLCMAQVLTLDSEPIASNVYRALDTIISSGTVWEGSPVGFIAGSNIRLNPGFHAGAGSAFYATIEACQIPVPMASSYQNPEVPLMEITGSELELSVFPNPFLREATLKYELPEAQQVSLFVTDFSGREIIRPINNQWQEKGSYEWKFYPGDLPPGIYLIAIKAGSAQTYKRVVLMR